MGFFSDPDNSTSPTIEGPQVQVAAVVLGLCCALGLPGNLVVLVVLLRNLEPNNFTQKLMLNLACCDLLSMVVLPIWVYSLTKGMVVLEEVPCRICAFLTFVTVYANMFIAMLMSLQRYGNVLHRQSWAKLGRVGETLLMLGLWVLTVVLTWPCVASWGWRKGHSFVCLRPPRMDSIGLAGLVLETLTGFIVPFTVIATSYSRLHKKVAQAAMVPNRRMTTLISRIVITCLVLWVPTHIVNTVGIIGVILKAFNAELADKIEKIRYHAEILTHILPFFSAVVDPFLYAFAFRKLLKVSRKLSRRTRNKEEEKTAESMELTNTT